MDSVEVERIKEAQVEPSPSRCLLEVFWGVTMTISVQAVGGDRWRLH